MNEDQHNLIKALIVSIGELAEQLIDIKHCVAGLSGAQCAFRSNIARNLERLDELVQQLPPPNE